MFRLAVGIIHQFVNARHDGASRIFDVLTQIRNIRLN
jgi:hypothetical protein